ncbi:unnamed protein product [Pedinophyceae sp. YPF-701]|nr:unnamed protein product [Pedinophyceae sp. YPF-701]
MLNLAFVKKKQEEEREAKRQEDANDKLSPSEMRMQKDMGELDLDSSTVINFVDGPDQVMHFEVVIRPPERTPYHGGRFRFDVSVPLTYPHDPPKVRCLTKVYHPNIDLEGNVCLNILREDWKPVLSVNSVIIGLQFLMSDPNPDDPLNKEAAEMMRARRSQFENVVAQHVRRGTYIGNDYFPACRD